MHIAALHVEPTGERYDGYTLKKPFLKCFHLLCGLLFWIAWNASHSGF